MDKIDIFYIATGVYCDYVEDFLKTIDNFFPGKHKVLHFLTDNINYLDDKEYVKDIKTDIEMIEIMDLPYPLIPLLKPYYILHHMKPEDTEWIFYFDADTQFLEKPAEYWEELESQINLGKIVISRHPFQFTDSGNIPATYEDNCNSIAFIPEAPDGYDYIISSMFGGTADAMVDFCKIVEKMTAYDLQKTREPGHWHHIPKFFDENHINKLVYEWQKGRDNGVEFCLRRFVCDLNGCVFPRPQEELDQMFISQKNNVEIKNRKKLY